jgi:ABC transporter substrate binding protein
MKRREFITLLGGAAAWPLVARAQQPARKIVKLGFLQAFRNENTVAFIEGLRSAGYIDGQNALVEARFYGSMPDRTLEVANELVSLQCDVIIATGPHAIQAAMSATSVLPIVGVDLESDPVAKGWATSLARPGKNLTGCSSISQNWAANRSNSSKRQYRSFQLWVFSGIRRSAKFSFVRQYRRQLLPELHCNRFQSSAPKNWKPRLIAPCAIGCKEWWSSLHRSYWRNERKLPVWL